MKSKTGDKNTENGWEEVKPDKSADASASDHTSELESATDREDFADTEEDELEDAEDDRWDVFILDDDDLEPLPEYGDFWFPD